MIGKKINFSSLLDLVYPNLCPACGVQRIEKEQIFCPICAEALTHPTEIDIHTHLQQGGFSFEESFEHYFSMWYFDKTGKIQKVQHELKYGNRPELGRIIGQRMGAYWLKKGLQLPDLIGCIPIAKNRFLLRGYNQSEMIGQGMSEVLKIPLEKNLLLRARDTRSQTTLSKKKRWENVQGAFAIGIPTDTIIGKHILLVDDVLTTGATLYAASKPMLQSSAKVSIATMALVR